MSLALPYLEVGVTYDVFETKNVDVEEEIESIMGTRDGWLSLKFVSDKSTLTLV